MSSSKPREVYLPVHVLDSCNVVSECNYYEVVRIEKEHEVVCIAKCNAINRYLIRSSAKKCVDYWRTCPLKLYVDSQLA
ncbi:MAG: hypothetical protein QW159_01335 [Desulfurococcaceae archaeon]